MLSLLQYQKQKLLQESAGVLGQSRAMKEVAAIEEVNANGEESSGNDDQSSENEAEIVYDEHQAEVCLAEEAMAPIDKKL